MFIRPQKIISILPMGAGMKVLDVGTGAGVYAILMSKLVGDDGVVYAIDIQKEMLSRVESEAKQNNIHNIVTILGDIEKIGGTKLKDESIDRIMVSNVVFQMEDRISFVKEVFRVLKKGGKLLLVDWLDTKNNIGPKSKNLFLEPQAEELFTYVGFKIVKKNNDNENHYAILFEKELHI